jgi:hypothetical protein
MARRAKTIDLLRVVDLLQAHITPALCRGRVRAVRKTERQRVWTLEAPDPVLDGRGVTGAAGPEPSAGRFAGGPGPDVPAHRGEPGSVLSAVSPSPPGLFAEVFQRFTAQLLTAVPARYAHINRPRVP